MSQAVAITIVVSVACVVVLACLGWVAYRDRRHRYARRSHPMHSQTGRTWPGGLPRVEPRSALTTRRGR